MQLIDGKKISQQLKEEIAAQVETMIAAGRLSLTSQPC